MCGILAILGIPEGASSQRLLALKLSKKLRHRGPDWSGIYAQGHNILAHERLAIVGIENGAQPLYNVDRNVILATNSEIYNHTELRKELEAGGAKFLTDSDSETILHSYIRDGAEAVKLLRGMFSFIIYDERTDSVYAGRDSIGIIPLYWGWGADGSLWFASELKAIARNCARFEEFPPGHYYFSTKGKGALKKFFHQVWTTPDYLPANPVNYAQLRANFEEAVTSHMMCHVPYGVLLSGGLDSSLVASIASRYKSKLDKELYSAKWWPALHSFAIGLDGSPDLKAAKEVADFIGTVHHTVHFTVQEGIDALSDVIYHLETFDLTTVRASTPMYLLARRIRAFGIKMVLSGEGADEIFGGYLYFHKAPNKEEFQKESVRKVTELNKYDCLRANKVMAAFGIEARVPFLDSNFMDYAMTLDPAEKMSDKSKNKMEKYILRKAFDDEKTPYLPASVLWRQKEQFSDGVGYSWIDGLKEYANKMITDQMFEQAKHRFPMNPPSSKEGYLYRQFFESHFPQHSALTCVPEQGFTVACSTAAVAKWDAELAKRSDPSGRTIAGVHLDALLIPGSVAASASTKHEMAAGPGSEELVSPSTSVAASEASSSSSSSSSTTGATPVAKD